MTRQKKKLNRIIIGANPSVEETSQVSSSHGENGESSSAIPGVELGESSRSKAKRGPTKLLDVWGQPNNERIRIQSNWKRQAVGPGSTTLARFLGVIARNPQLCPLGHESWHLVPKMTKMAAISLIKQKFSYPNCLEKFVMKTLGRRWKDYKGDLKAKFYDPQKSTIENAMNVPPRVSSLDWQFLVTYWKSDKGKEIKKNREIGEVELYRASRSKKDGRIINEDVAEKVRLAEELLANKSIASQSDPRAIELEVMVEVFGEHRNGRVYGMGGGPTPTQISEELESIFLNKKNKDLEEKVNVLQNLYSNVMEELNVLKSQLRNQS